MRSVIQQGHRNRGRKLGRRILWVSGCLMGLLAFSFPGQRSFADQIILKNGNVIEAEFTWEEGHHIRYLVHGGTYGVAKAAVQRVVSLPRPVLRKLDLNPSMISKSAQELFPGTTEPSRLPNRKSIDEWVQSLLPRAATYSRMNEERQSRLVDLNLQMRHDPKDDLIHSEWLNVTGAVVGERLVRNDLRGAADVLAKALEISPGEFALQLQLGAVALRLNDYPSARKVLKSALQVNPHSAECLELLGLAEYFLGNNSRAIAHWREASKFSDQAPLEGLIAKAEREEVVEKNFRFRSSAHFEMSSDRKTMRSALSDNILEELERNYSDLSALFGVTPPGPIEVVLYSTKEFQQATSSQEFIAGLNDGKIRVPVQGVSELTPALIALLKHELAHTFMQVKSLGRAPHWIHEGMAQMISHAGVCDRGNSWWGAVRNSKLIPLASLDSTLEAPPSSEESSKAYGEALSLVCYIDDRFGQDSLQRLLSESALRGRFDSAVRSVLHDSLDRVEVDWRNYIELIARF